MTENRTKELATYEYPGNYVVVLREQLRKVEGELAATREEHARLADAASAYIETVDRDFVGDMPAWFDRAARAPRKERR